MGRAPFANWIVESLRFNGVHLPISQVEAARRTTTRRAACDIRVLHAAEIAILGAAHPMT
jgi:hypothetical protein